MSCQVDDAGLTWAASFLRLASRALSRWLPRVMAKVGDGREQKGRGQLGKPGGQKTHREERERKRSRAVPQARGQRGCVGCPGGGGGFLSPDGVRRCVNRGQDTR